MPGGGSAAGTGPRVPAARSGGLGRVVLALRLVRLLGRLSGAQARRIGVRVLRGVVGLLGGGGGVLAHASTVAPPVRVRIRAHTEGMRTAALLAGLALLTGCSGPDAGPAPPVPPMTAPPSTGPSARERPTDLADPAAPGPSPVTFPLGDAATGLDVPWGLAFLPDGTALVTLRDRAEVLHLRPGAEPVSLGPVPGVAPGGEGGLLGIDVEPDDATAV